MDTLFSLLFLASLAALVVGLYKPSILKQESRKNVGIIFGTATVLLLIAVSVSSPKAPEQQSAVVATNTTSPVADQTATQTPTPSTQSKTQTPAAAPASNTTQPPKTTTVAPPAPAPQAPTATIQANGSTGSASIPYGSAATISWSSTNANSCNVSPSGWTGASGTQSTGSLTSSKTYSLSCSGAGGSASANVAVNVSAPPPPSSPSPINLSGNSQTATQKFTLQQGLSVFTLNNSGKSNFIVSLLDGDGNEVAYLSNAIGDYSGSVAVQVSKTGSYLLNVQSDGSWTIDITQPRANSAPATTSFNATGDEATAFFSLSSGLHTFNLTNSGSGNFIVELLDKNGNDVDYLENVIGDFSGSKAEHIDTTGVYLLSVKSGSGSSSGTWSITIQ